MFSAVQFMPDDETSRSCKQIKDIVHSSPKLTSQNSQGECQIKGRKHLYPTAQFDRSYSARKFIPKLLLAFFLIYYLAIFWPNTKSTPALDLNTVATSPNLKDVIPPSSTTTSLLLFVAGGNPGVVPVQDVFQTTAKPSGDEEGRSRRNGKTIRSTDSFILAAHQDHPSPRPDLLQHKEFYCQRGIFMMQTPANK